MKKILLILLMGFQLSGYSQFAIINDPDGFTNVREEKSTNSKVVGWVKNDDIFLAVPENENDVWWSVYKSSKDSYIQGYVHKSRIQPLEQLSHISRGISNRKLSKNKLLISNDTISLSISLKPFNKNTHQTERDKHGFVRKIDRIIPNGVDGGLPKIEIESLVLKIRGSVVEIPKLAYKDLFETGLDCVNIYFDNRGNTYIYMPCNSDGAGGYFAALVIKDNKYKMRYIDAP